MIIDWVAPSDQGSSILGYRVYIRALDLDYKQELTQCDGSLTDIISATQCAVALDTLTASPFDLQLGNSIYVKVVAYNYYGDSSASPAGNGGVLVLVPDAPISLTNDPSVTSSFVIGFNWVDGPSNGGTEILDYRITYD